MAAARFLRSRGARVAAADSASRRVLSDRIRELENLDVSVHPGGHGPEIFEQAELIVLSPGVPHTLEPIQRAAAKGVPVIGEVELASRFP